MSRITGTDAKGLMEAYAAVYAPQELTEEQVWEEVETWVNSLLEEGYDLSDYTWEEMYEAYIEEVWGTKPGQYKPNKLDTAVGNVVKSITSSGADATPRTTGIYGQPTRKSTPTPAAPSSTFQNTGGFGRYGAPGTQERTPAPAATAAATTPTGTKPPVTPTGTKPPVTPTGTKPPAGTPPGGKVAPTKPAAPAKPATGMLGKTSFERRTPTSAELKAAQAARAGGEKSPEKVLQAAKAASAPSPARSGFGVSAAPIAAKASVANVTAPEVKATNTAAAKTTPTPVTPKAPTGGPRTRAQVLGQSFDPFDIIKGHLIDEGYADTEEAALKIMANMSEEWRQSIVEGEENKEDSQKPFTGEGPKKPKGWRPTGPKLKSGQRPGYAR